MQALPLLLALSGFCLAQAPKRNIIIFVADGLRAGSVNPIDAPTMYNIRTKGVFFSNSHSLFPTFTTANASAMATGHYLGDTSDYSNTLYAGFPIFNTGNFGKTTGTQTPFVENNQVLGDIDTHVAGGNYLNETTLMAAARMAGYNTSSVGKVGPVGIQDVTQLNPVAKNFVTPKTIFIDDATGSGAGIPLSMQVSDGLIAAGLGTTPTARNQPAGSVSVPGTLNANLGQQQYFADATTKTILPLFKKSGKPFMLLFWSRDPDGTQHNQGDSLNSLVPGINGPTSKAAIKNADNNLAQILAYINSDPALQANTDVFVTADHGFATISKHEIDNHGGVTHSYSTGFAYMNAAGLEVLPGWLPAGFLAIDLAHHLSLPLFDPDNQITGTSGIPQYEPVDPNIQLSTTIRQRPASGNGLIGGTGAVLTPTDAKVIVAANGGSDLIYVPSKDPALTAKIVAFLSAQDYIGGLFVNSSIGTFPGALPLSAINLEGDSLLPRPTIAVNFKSFSLDNNNPLQTAVQIADSTLQEGQGMHGSLGRDNTYNNMAAIGPDFKTGYVDTAPVSNADIAPTFIQLLGLSVAPKGSLQGRILKEALIAGSPATAVQNVKMAAPSAAKTATILRYQSLGGQTYFDIACLADTTKPPTINNNTCSR